MNASASQHSASDGNYRYIGPATLIIGLVLMATAVFGLQEVRYWQEYGVPAQGRVLEKITREDCQTGSAGSGAGRSCATDHVLRYQYTTSNGLSFAGEDSINEADWHALDPGSTVALVYSSLRPAESSVSYATDPDTQESLWLLVMAVGGVLALMGVALFALLLIRRL